MVAAFLAIVRRAGLRGAPGHRGPRLHDLRHSFAVYQLLAWYRDGGDVQARLPLGARCLVSTQVYLDVTAELLQEAARRFHPPALPGVGKTHLAVSIAVAAAEGGHRLYYATLADLITSLEDAQQAGRLSHRLRTLLFPSLMIIDEIRYLPISRTGAMLFFRLMSRGYEHASTVLTSNNGFEEWGEVLGDDVMAAALIGRLLHHCHIVNIRGNSYRMRDHRALATRLAPRRRNLPHPAPAGPAGRRPKPSSPWAGRPLSVQFQSAKVCNSDRR